MHLTRITLPAAALVAALGATQPAGAGTIIVRDGADVLTPAEEADLTARATPDRLRVQIVTSRSQTARGAFDAFAQGFRDTPETVVIALDPEHRWTVVRYGIGARIVDPRGTLADAGDAAFREGRWADGLRAIVDATGEAAQASPAEVARRARTAFPVGTVIVAVLAVGGLAWLLGRRRHARSTYVPPPPAMMPPWAPRGGPGSAPQAWGYGGGPEVPLRGGATGAAGAVGAGLAGAALGGLAGYALGRTMEHDGDPHTVTPLDGDVSDWGGGGSNGGDGNDW